MVVLTHVVSLKDILFADPEKVRVIKKWLVPIDQNYLRAFLGTAGYCPNNFHIVSPLYRPLQKRNRFKKTAECERVFLHIKRKLSNAPILTFIRMGVPFILDTGADLG